MPMLFGAAPDHVYDTMIKILGYDDAHVSYNTVITWLDALLQNLSIF